MNYKINFNINKRWVLKLFSTVLFLCQSVIILADFLRCKVEFFALTTT